MPNITLYLDFQKTLTKHYMKLKSADLRDHLTALIRNWLTGRKRRVGSTDRAQSGSQSQVECHMGQCWDLHSLLRVAPGRKGSATGVSVETYTLH